MKRVTLAATLILVLTGCMSLGGRTSYVKDPDGKTWEVRCQSDGNLDYTNGVVKLSVDNRGPLGTVWAVGTASVGKIYDRVKGEPVEVK